MEIILCTPQDNNTWDSFVLEHPQATSAHLFAWKNVIEDSYKHKTFYLMAREGGKVGGILPLVSLKIPDA